MSEINAHMAARVALEVVGQLDAKRERLRSELDTAEASLGLASWSDPMNAWNSQEVYRLRRELATVEKDLVGARDRAYEIALIAARRDGLDMRAYLREFSII